MSRTAHHLAHALRRRAARLIPNREGFPAWERPLREQYLQALVCNTLSNTFYASAGELLVQAHDVHAAMFREDPAFAARGLVYARQRGFMRTQPLLALAMLSGVDRARFAEVFDRVVLTPADLSDFTSLLKGLRGGEGGRAVKRAAGAWLMRLDEYRVVKYGAEKGAGAYSLRDLVRVYHPRAGGPGPRVEMPLMRYLLGRADALALAELPQVRAYEAYKVATSDGEKARLLREGRLPHEVVTAHAGSSTEVWDALVPQLPPLALLRHLRALERHGVLEAHRERITRVFTDPSVVAHSRILPFRFLEAARHVETAWLKDALRAALDAAFVSVPDLPGSTVVALDRSGSMSAYMAQASVLALSLVRKARGRTRFMLFDDRLEDVALRADQGILAQAEGLHARGGTNHALVVDRLLVDREVVDNLVYVTDEQQNVGSPLLERLDTYRRRVNPRVKVFIINVAPYAGGAAPPHEPDTWFAYGWNDATVAFVSMAARGLGSMVDLVERGAWDPQVQ